MNGKAFGTTFFKPPNMGVSWTLVNDPDATPFTGSQMTFVNDSVGYALTDGFTVSKTTNGVKICEPLPRDNDFTYLGFGFKDLKVLSVNQLWAGGGHGELELSTNGGGLPLPKAYFKIATSNFYQNAAVRLKNFSRPGYAFQWGVNGSLISNAYDASYTHNVDHFIDTITLLVNNGVRNDTQTKAINFRPPLQIDSFSPTVGTTLTVVTINGRNLSDAMFVGFGGVRAYSVDYISDTKIIAAVGEGASGPVSVTTPAGAATLPAYTYIPPPVVDLPTVTSKNILGKSERIMVALQNTEANVRYELVDSLGTSKRLRSKRHCCGNSIRNTNTTVHHTIGKYVNVFSGIQ